MKLWFKSLNTYPSQFGFKTVICGLAVFVLFHGWISASALGGRASLDQYVHSSWGPDKGYLGGTAFAIAQSGDGYLWFGTEHGLLRFDGYEFTLIVHLPSDNRPFGAVRGLVEDADGNLWIRLNGSRVLRYRDGTFDDAESAFELFDITFTAMSRDSSKNMLLWGLQRKTVRFRNGQFSQFLSPDKIDGIVVSMLETSPGELWLATRDSGLYKFGNGAYTQVIPHSALRSINALAPAEDGVWIGSDNGLHLWIHGRMVPLDLPEGLRKAQVLALARDHHRNLWVGTDKGLYRVDNQSKLVTGLYRDGGDNPISAIYEDAEGDIWFAGLGGVDRLREGMFTSISQRDTSLKEIGGPIFVDGLGRTWFAPISGGLFCLQDGTTKRVASPELDHDIIYSITGSDDDLWLGRQKGGLTELRRVGNDWLAHTYTQKDGLAQNSVYTVTRAHDGSVWAGTVSGGISVLRNGRFTTYDVNNGLKSNAVFSSLEAADKKLWFASPSGLVSLDDGRWTTYATPNAGTTVNARTLFEDSNHILWVGTSHGVGHFNHGRIEMPFDPPQLLNEEVLSIGEDVRGFLWIVTSAHVLQIDRAKLLSGSIKENDVLSYGLADGLTETEGVRRDRSLFSDSSGHIWLSLMHSLAVADVNADEGYRRPVRVRIDSVSIDNASPIHEQYLNLPSGIHALTFRFSGISLSMPQRTRFRYRLDGLDHTWSSDASFRQVAYGHLSHGSYTFRIMGSNALGAWNGPETDVSFTIRPAFWQTWYFQVLLGMAIVAAAIALYRFRLLQLKQQLNRRFEDRLVERTRIAQDLHDTLLQDVISASMQLDVAQDDVPDHSAAKPQLRRVLQLMRQATVDGRAALRGLRTVDSLASLDEIFLKLVDEFSHTSISKCEVKSRGNPHELKPVVRDEVCRIGREAYINAVSHAKAKQISIVIDYGLRTFRFMVTDDGSGIDPEILERGREGHWGLSGMKERAKAIGCALKIRSRTPGGTEVELSIPAAIAYSPQNARQTYWLRRYLNRYSRPKGEK
ncbi:Sensor histidine kinase VraS [Granulicella sibirica]|uniref:Sensor histidine kinase VraS n=1 Tax=Granulicella sibirica TaxID=2479048 RepID=A0A4Q0T8Q5_9BACT|nr:Sensor histidine kinase VraS [Granulicella sibirica]